MYPQPAHYHAALTNEAPSICICHTVQDMLHMMTLATPLMSMLTHACIIANPNHNCIFFLICIQAVCM